MATECRSTCVRVDGRAAREVEQLLDDLGDALGLRGDDAGVLGDLGRDRPAFFSMRAGAAADDVERRADLVRDAGGELADGGQLLRVAQARLERQLGVDAVRGSPRALRASEPVISLKRSARSPTSSSRSRRMTRPRSPWVTSSMASTRRLSGLRDRGARRQPDQAGEQRRQRHQRPDDGAARCEQRLRHVLLVAHQLHGGDDAVLFVAHRLDDGVGGLAVDLDVLAKRRLVDRHDLQSLGARRIVRRRQVEVFVVGAERRALGAGDGAGGKLAVVGDGGAGGDDERGRLQAGAGVGDVEVGEADVGRGVLPAGHQLACVLEQAVLLGGVEGDADRGAEELHLALEIGVELGAARAQADPTVEAEGQEHERHRGERDACADLHRRLHRVAWARRGARHVRGVPVYPGCAADAARRSVLASGNPVRPRNVEGSRDPNVRTSVGHACKRRLVVTALAWFGGFFGSAAAVAVADTTPPTVSPPSVSRAQSICKEEMERAKESLHALDSRFGAMSVQVSGPDGTVWSPPMWKVELASVSEETFDARGHASFRHNGFAGRAASRWRFFDGSMLTKDWRSPCEGMESCSVYDRPYQLQRSREFSTGFGLVQLDAVPVAMVPRVWRVVRVAIEACARADEANPQ